VQETTSVARPDSGPKKILVIRLGALGDFVLSLGPMAAIREAHSEALITLLTTGPFEQLARETGYFDDIWSGGRPKRFSRDWWSLRHKLRAGNFDRTYDLQTSARTIGYWKMMGRPEWSGHAPGCSFPDDNPDRGSTHTADRQRYQLRAAGIEKVGLVDLSWANTSVGHFRLSDNIVLLVPGGSVHRPGKRWSVEKYAALARRIRRLGLTPVLLGGSAEEEVLAEIEHRTPGARNLCGQTNFSEIASLARQARGAVGNDTGPMHLIAAAGCPSMVLFSDESDPSLCAPRPGAQGGVVAVLQRDFLDGLSVEDVETRLPFSLTH
jgi:ADP-heptose:LPS heptosyltransferase